MPVACQSLPAQKLVDHSTMTNLASSSKNARNPRISGVFVHLSLYKKSSSTRFRKIEVKWLLK